ncbi:MAG: nucleotidyltransferase domain-containing protein [Lentisphaeria bacterium]|nr:nucleotidyltransferase domain-containing protein [Lentisphaeria bacterium]
MCQLDRLRRLRGGIYEIARKHKAGKVYLFGSCARKEETPDSDVDFIVEFHGASAFDHMRLELEWSEFLKMPVDVVSMGALGQDYFAEQVRREMVRL